MTYNVFGGTLSLTQSINQSLRSHPAFSFPISYPRSGFRLPPWAANLPASWLEDLGVQAEPGRQKHFVAF